MKEGTAAVHASTVREFLYIIVAQAKAALAGIDRPGFLQLSRLHPTSETLVPSRFSIGDVESMINTAIADSDAGHNVYLEGRTIREDAPRGNGRGKLEDTAAVFALVVDSDADKQMGWTPNVRVSMTVATSPGNFQFWLFLREGVSAEVGKRLGELIRAVVNSDHDTGNPTQPYRVAGTVNYPGAKKIKRGRVTVPTQIIEFDPEALWTPEEIEQAFPLPERKTDGGGSDAVPAAGGATDENRIPADTMAAIRDGVGKGNDRSHVFWNVILALKHSGWTIDGITELLERHPDGIARKYYGRLRQEVERVYNKIQTKREAQPAPSRPSGPAGCAGTIMSMHFAPIKYVIPGVVVEGLTLFAGKPKIGKSWLLLHAAVAVATGGFTLGQIHCPQGDVLYCALEDNKRRIQSRLKKLVAPDTNLSRLFFYTYDEMARLSEGGLDAIKTWLRSVSHPRLVIIDTLAMVRSAKKKDESSYDADYNAVLELRSLANEFGVAIIVVHHLRKADADDAFDTVSGTLGLTGAPDSIVILKYDSAGTIVLHGRGRDLAEIEMAMSFNHAACTWQVAGDARDLRRSTERAKVLDAIKEAGEPIGPNTIASMVGMKAGSVRMLLQKLAKEGVIERVGYGKYQVKQPT
jgi:AAA domain/IclR helix-turn-helix domain